VISAPAALLLWLLAAGPGEAPSPRPVSRDEILEAMRRSQGYNLEATTNGARLQGEVLLRLVREAEAGDPQRRPLFIGHGPWFSAYLERTGLTAEQAPLFERLAHEHGQDIEVDYRRERVLESADPAPAVAANVIVWWPSRPRGPKSYSYEDLLSTPRLKVTNERVITYRLLDLEGMIVFDQVDGLRGRPTTGLLGVLFKLIGEGHVVDSRMIVSEDGLQVTRARARKAFFEVAPTVTVFPDGRTEKDLPPGRPDLRGLDERLKKPLPVRYRPLDAAWRNR